MRGGSKHYKFEIIATKRDRFAEPPCYLVGEAGAAAGAGGRWNNFIELTSVL